MPPRKVPHLCPPAKNLLVCHISLMGSQLSLLSRNWLPVLQLAHQTRSSSSLRHPSLSLPALLPFNVLIPLCSFFYSLPSPYFWSGLTFAFIPAPKSWGHLEKLFPNILRCTLPGYSWSCQPWIHTLCLCSRILFSATLTLTLSTLPVTYFLPPMFL